MKAPRIKTLKVYRRKVKGRPPYPEVRLSGRYLEGVGIEIGSTVRVVVRNGRITVERKEPA